MTITGNNFGLAQGSLAFTCAGNNNPGCSGSDITVQSFVSIPPGVPAWASSRITATLQAGVNASGDYDVQVISNGSVLGSNGLPSGFQSSGGTNPTSPNSNIKGTVSVTAQIFPQFSITSVAFTNSYPIAADLPGGATPLTAIDSTVWRSSCTTPPCVNPSAFAQGTQITASVTLALSFAPTTSLSNVRIEGVISGLGTLSGFVASVPAGTSSMTVPVTTSTALPSGTRLYNPMSISWQYALSDSGNAPCGGQVFCQLAGTSSSDVYVTLATPSARYMFGVAAQPILPLPFTVLGLAVGAGGATTPAAAFQNTWARFSQGGGPANVTNWQNPPQKLYYYRNGTGFGCATTALQLLTRTDGDGQCGSFAYLLMWALAANGIPSHWVTICATDGCNSDGTLNADWTRLVIRNWTFGTETYPGDPSYSWQLLLNTGDYMFPAAPGDQYGDLHSENTIPGQNTTPPAEKVFDFHFIVFVDPSIGPSGYYDPSYGVSYPGAEADFESNAVAGYARSFFGDRAGTYRVRKPGGGTNITFAVQ